MNIENRLPSYPLIKRYLEDYVRQLHSRSPDTGPPGETRFYDIFSRGEPEKLEKRLRRTHNTEAFQSIFREIGSIRDSNELDRRLIDAWAEIRVIDQLVCERLVDIRKEMPTIDFVARYMSQLYAVQVTRVGREAQFSDLPTGRVDEIYNQAGDRIGRYFWDSLNRKNSQIREISSSEYVRRIVLVTTTYRLRDSLNRHMACRQIRNSILDLADRYFEEVQWLLDGGDNAIFWVETGGGGTRVRCIADWIDQRTATHREDYDNCYWREIDLESVWPAYV
jgi:hypothetical protein